MGRAWGGGAIVRLAADIKWGKGKADSSGVGTASIVQCRVGGEEVKSGVTFA